MHFDRGRATPAWLPVLAAAFLAPPALTAQSTQASIYGQVLDRRTNLPVQGAEIQAEDRGGETRRARTDPFGAYAVLLLSPGVYRIRVARNGYQSAQTDEIELFVGARVTVDFALRPVSDVWGVESRRYLYARNERLVNFYAADVHHALPSLLDISSPKSESVSLSQSYVIDRLHLDSLPLSGRDVYAMLAYLPGVVSATGSGRGLGISTNGQRPSASNFLLDGLENNDNLATGPLAEISPEAVREYRVSVNEFSAEFGHSGGFVANAVTRTQPGGWRGLGYADWGSESLNANSFQSNRTGVPRLPSRRRQAGFTVGGPGLRSRRFSWSGAYDRLHSAETLPGRTFTFPSATPEGEAAKRLLARFAPPGTALRVTQPVTLNQSLATLRASYQPSGRLEGFRVMTRLAIARISRPDFIWSPYRDFVSGLRQDGESLAVTAQGELLRGLLNETRFGWGSADLSWDRAFPDVPSIEIGGAAAPGSPAAYAYRNRGRNWQLHQNLLLTKNRHSLKFGGGFMLRTVDGHLTLGRGGLYRFRTLFDFEHDSPDYFLGFVNRQESKTAILPVYDRRYSRNEFHLFAEDSIRLSQRLMIQAGVRFEASGTPKNVGAEKDAVVQLDKARFVFPEPAGQKVYSSGSNDFAGRLGFTYALPGRARTLVRGAYGLFYEQPFDNLWQNVRTNSLVAARDISGAAPNYNSPLAAVLASGRLLRLDNSQSIPTLIDPRLRTPYVQNWLAGIEQAAGAWRFEITNLNSIGKKLITTDVLNRAGPGQVPALPNVSYRANQGFSSYHALSAVLRRRASSSGMFQAAYTWSHTIDNQSEPLAGDFFNLQFTRAGPAPARRPRAGFYRAGEAAADRGNSSFDQRHSLVFYSIWAVPVPFVSSPVRPFLRGWNIAQVAAFRSGFPYSVFSREDAGDVLLASRVDLLRADHVADNTPVPGGRRILLADAFGYRKPGSIGSLGRNALRGPGAVSLDVSLSRSFRLARLGESGRLVIRADAFNVLNHANLDNPEGALTGAAEFGVAAYGRKSAESDFPGRIPFDETPRRIELLLKIEF